MTAKTRSRVLIALGVVAAIAALLFHYKQRDSYRCQICFATKSFLQWRIGVWGAPSVPLTPSWERITETRFEKDFMSSNHVHTWIFAQGSPYYFFGTTWGGCAIGAGRHVSDLCYMYETSPTFRSFLAQELRDGSLTKSNVIALTSIQRTGEKASPLQNDADALLAKYYSR
jgi:hypothetical protein